MKADRIKNRAAIILVAFTILCLSVVASAAEPVTIRFHYRGGGARTQVVQEWIAAFEKQNPDIKVEWEQPTSGWQDKLIVAMAGGTAPDVVEFWGTFAQQLARNGRLLDLRPYVARDFSEDDIADFFPASWQGSFVQFGPNAGQQFALPRYINTMVTYYNKTLFDEAGLLTPQDLYRNNDWTWDQLQESSRKLTRSDGGQTVQWGFQTMTRNWDRMVQWMWEAGGDWFDPNDPTKFIGDRPEAQAAIDFLYQMIWEDGTAYTDLDWNTFWNGQIGMSDDGIAVVFSRYEDAIGTSFEWDLAPRAAGPNGRKPWATDDGVGIWVDSPHPEEAWRFIKFITSREGQEIMLRHEGLAPVRRSATAAYLELSDHLNLGVFLDTMMDAQMGITNRVPGDIDRIGSELNSLVRAAVRDNTTPYAVAVQEAKRTIEAIIRETVE